MYKLLKNTAPTLICIIILATLAGCSGGGDGEEASNYYMRAKIDGNWLEVRNPIAHLSQTNEGYNWQIIIGGYLPVNNWESTRFSVRIDATMENSTSIAEGTYYEIYNDAYDLDCYYYTNPSGDDNYWNSGYYEAEDFVLVITQLDNNTCRGTFYGTLQSASGHSVMQITEGEFFVSVSL
ncbi:MAG: hypothetical protein Q4G08_00170 [Capnocytophaga sp.]|nr:hypothetical protein [Capnocytophaga sp.]